MTRLAAAARLIVPVDAMGIWRSEAQKAMAQARNNKSEAARLLGLTRAQLYSRLKHHSLGA